MFDPTKCPRVPGARAKGCQGITRCLAINTNFMQHKMVIFADFRHIDGFATQNIAGDFRLKTVHGKVCQDSVWYIQVRQWTQAGCLETARCQLDCTRMFNPLVEEFPVPALATRGRQCENRLLSDWSDMVFGPRLRQIRPVERVRVCDENPIQHRNRALCVQE